MAQRRTPRFRGRTAERERLSRLLDGVRGGSSEVLVVRGEAGVGKTALLRWLAGAAPDFQVGRIVGVESEMELPFAGLHQLCAPMLDRLDALPEPQRQALRIAFGMAAGEAPDRFLVGLAALGLVADVAEERPLLCVVDDAQWLDGASSQVLGFVARRLGAEPVAFVFTVRGPADQRELDGLPRLELAGLDAEDARALLAVTVPGRLDDRVRDRIVEETGGNPLALLELPASLSPAELAGGFVLPDAASVPGRIEEHYRARIAELPEPTRRLVLLAAADSLGDATLVWRAAQALGVGREAAGPAAAARLLEIGGRVRFRHPLVRSAAYRGASVPDRRAVHGALAAATDPDADPDRRTWHRAHAATAPDEAVATELLESAARAQRRGGIAAAAAFLERAVTFTPDPAERASRALGAAVAKFEAAEFAAAQSLLATADVGPLSVLDHALVQRLRAQIAFDLRRGSDAPPLLLSAGGRLAGLEPQLAEETYLEALIAVVYAARLANPNDVAAVTAAARTAAPAGVPAPRSADPDAPPAPGLARRRLLAGLATRLTDGYVAAAPALAAALRAYLAGGRGLDRLGVGYTLAAMDLWDDGAWLAIASTQVDLARATGTLVLLPYALDYLAGFHVQAGDLALASRLLAEADGIDMGARASTLPYVPLRQAAWRGDALVAADLAESMTRGAHDRGEGSAIAAADYATALLDNGLGRYDRGFDAARKAADSDEVAISSWALAELAEAAARSGRTDAARRAVDRLAERTRASGTAWALGTEAAARALLEDGGAETFHREAVDCLAHCRMAAHLGRARLSYGEWLRREGRRVDAREQLRGAYAVFTAMGADGFAERGRRELLATGERVRRRRDDTQDELTPQEEQIARLAGDGRTNPEIGAELYLSPRTVEWHLRKVFAKLGITSRKGLGEALAERT